MAPRPLPAPTARRALVSVSLASSVFGGLLAWTGAFAGLGVSAFAVGAAATLVPMYVFARNHPAGRPLSFMLSFAFAFVVLTWPILWLGVAYARSLRPGQPLGE